MVATAILFVGLVDSVQTPTAVSPAPAATVDCGTSSLYTLLRLEGKGVAFDILCKRMPGGAQRAHTLAELRDCAHSFGLRLRGVRLPVRRESLDRPMLVFLDQKPHGHFVVVRPVGHSGNLVQVFDPGLEPAVMDAAALFASPEWTGIALVPEGNDPLIILTTILVVLLVVVSCSWLLRRRG